MKTVFMLLLVISLNANSNMGGPRGTDKCVIGSSSKIQTIRKFENWCEGFGVLVNKKNIGFLSLRPCPKPFKNKHIFVKSNFMKFSNNQSVFDDIEISNRKTCAVLEINEILSTEKTQRIFQNKILNLEKGTPLKKLTDINFFKIRSKDLVWTYHLTPGISADVEITGEMCGKEICLDEKKQKISKILNVYKDFIMMDDENKIYYSSAVDGK